MESTLLWIETGVPVIGDTAARLAILFTVGGFDVACVF